MLEGMADGEKMTMMMQMMPNMMGSFDMEKMPEMMGEMMPNMWKMMDEQGMSCSVMMPQMMPKWLNVLFEDKSPEEKKDFASRMISAFEQWL